jgi:hypothetical protein
MPTLHMLEEAEKRDHRRLGKQLDLFHLQEEAPGLVFWHPNGLDCLAGRSSSTCGTVYRRGNGYQRGEDCPQILDRVPLGEVGALGALQAPTCSPPSRRVATMR